MTTNEIQTASMNALHDRQDALIAHPEHSWRIRDEIRGIDEELMHRDLLAKCDAEIALEGWAA